MFKQWRLPAEQFDSIDRLPGRLTVIAMKIEIANEPPHERYVVEVDGQAKAEYRIFVKALTAGLQLRQEFPNSHVTLRDVGEETAH
jgi:hypothetical protein